MSSSDSSSSMHLPDGGPRDGHDEGLSSASAFDRSLSILSVKKDTFELGVGKKEDGWVLGLRILTGSVLVGVAIVVCLVVYSTGRGGEKKQFEQEFSNLAAKLVQSFEHAVKQRFDVLESFGDGLTVEANGNWPFVTFQDFSERMERLSQVSEIMAAHMLHRVTRDQLAEWNDYTFSNASSWRKEGISRERDIPLEEVETDMYLDYVYNPWLVAGLNTPVDESKPEGPYYPIWQSYPVSDFALANLDLGSDWEHTVPLNKVYQTQKPVFEYTYDYLGHIEKEGDPRASFIEGNKYIDYQDDPHATAMVPLFDKFGEDRQVAAVLCVYIYWKQYFDGLLPPGADGVIVVLENTCNQTYTYQVRASENSPTSILTAKDVQVDGAYSRWLSRGDTHDPKYDKYEVRTTINSIVSGEDEASYNPLDYVPDVEDRGFLYYDCLYNIRVYPSEEFEKTYQSGKPLGYAVILASLFAFTIGVFVFYHKAVERRQQLVLQAALQSGQLVSSLYPEEVRKRLYDEQLANRDGGNSNWAAASMDDDDDQDDQNNAEEKKAAIASLYPEATVLFIDIAGFTKWSSQRTPCQVFELLEALYGAFDKAARRRGVFKVETIGDSYMAVTGVPNAREDHAVAMVKFAHECLSILCKLRISLSKTLGEGTKDLAARIGIHSGPVTAGVLRGEKSRFQLFGDTVNTASRMESTGIPDRIQVSEETAKALIAGGKSSWLTLRDDQVIAKGKGAMTTYFCNVRVMMSRRSSMGDTTNTLDDDTGFVSI